MIYDLIRRKMRSINWVSRGIDTLFTLVTLGGTQGYLIMLMMAQFHLDVPSDLSQDNTCTRNLSEAVFVDGSFNAL